MTFHDLYLQHCHNVADFHGSITFMLFHVFHFLIRPVIENNISHHHAYQGCLYFHSKCYSALAVLLLFLKPRKLQNKGTSIPCQTQQPLQPAHPTEQVAAPRDNPLSGLRIVDSADVLNRVLGPSGRDIPPSASLHPARK